MAVSLIINETINPVTNISDALSGGGTGIDMGPCANNSYAPIISKSGNTGEQKLYVRHDAEIDPITDVKSFIQTYGVGTSFTYGGANSAADDFTSIKALGNASGNSKNNVDGKSGGLWIDMNASRDDTSRFDQATYPLLVKIYGDNLTDGTDLTTAFGLVKEAMVYDNSGTETLATTPVDGTIGLASDTVLGDNANISLRVYLPDSHTEGGILQVELVFAYSYTA